MKKSADSGKKSALCSDYCPDGLHGRASVQIAALTRGMVFKFANYKLARG